MLRRYGGMSPQPETPAPVAQAPKGPSLLLDEKQLRITMTIEAVRLKESGAPGEPVAKPAKVAGNPATAPARQVAPAPAEGGN